MRFHLPGLLALAFSLASCGAAPIKLINGPMAPAAGGEITTEEGPNGNLEMRITVEHLAAPEKIEPGAKVYVVWIEKAGATPQNVGALKVGEDRSGELDTLTPHHRFTLAITAEEEPTAAFPKGPRVLSAVVAR